MKKYFNVRLFYYFSLLTCIVLVFSTCKKGDDSASNVPTAPNATTNTAVWLGQRWATLKATVSANNDSTKVSFEYDTTIVYTHTIDAIPDTVQGNIGTLVRGDLTGLRPNTKYHYRVKAVNSMGTAYGSDVTFTTTDSVTTVILFNPALSYGTVPDIEGNIYKTIQIGTQTWMAENLRTEKYNDGTPIPFVTDVSAWSNLSTPAFCYYNNDLVYYGGLYNWYSVNTGKLCPDGWHVPTDGEWTVLTDFLGGMSTAGEKMKEAGTSHWLLNSTTVTNESGFSAVPGGYRGYLGGFNGSRIYAYWWSSTESIATDSWYRDVFYNYMNVDRSNSNKRSGLNVRCLKN